MLKFVFITFLFFNLMYSYGQHQNLKPKSDWTKNNSKYVENTVVVKLKPEYSKIIKGKFPVSEYIKKNIKGLSITSLKQLFPMAEPLVSNYNKHGQKLVDLSNTYIIRYTNDKLMRRVVEEMMSSGLFEYAEPLFLEEPLLIPNDPNAALNSNQWHLARIKAYEAWDIEKGDTNVVIGIVDTDFNINHEDLIGNVKYNYNDIINGKDDDKDGFIDNFSGWDIANNDNDVRAKQVVVQKTIKSSTGQDSIINVTLNGHGHASLSAGISSATTNNSLGIAGVGYNCKFLPIKAMVDVDAETGSVSYGYQGLIYAANRGCKVINLSWGSTNSYSHAAQEAINYAVYNKDVLVVAAAGNKNIEENYYPASYENVLSVAASSLGKSATNETIDIKADFATYNFEVDISAPGASIYTTYKANNYTSTKGSSLAAPQVAGAAALVRSKYKDLSALQAGELLRVTADVMDTNALNKSYQGKIGKGRLNVYRALTDSTSPSVRMYHNNLSDSVLHISSNNDTLTVIADFVNLLYPTKNLQVTLSSISSSVQVIDSISNLKILNTLDSTNNLSDPFKIVVLPTAKSSEVITLKLSYKDSLYTDYQYFYIIVNPNYLTIYTSEIDLTESGIGRLGLHDVFSKMHTGIGMRYKNETVLYEGGLMISASGNRLSNCVRNEKGNMQDNNFTPIRDIKFVSAVESDVETFTEYKDTSKLNVPVSVTQRSWAWESAPSNKYIIIEYAITNYSSSAIDTLRAGIFADWDIKNSNANRGDWDSENQLGYIYQVDNSMYAGTALLSNAKPLCFTIDNVGSTGLGLYDGFTKSEKIKTLSLGVNNASFTTLKGSDVSQVIGAEIYNLKPSETRKIGFSIQAGDNLLDLQSSVGDAKAKYGLLNIVTQVKDKINSSKLTLFPNPASNFLNILNIDKEISEIEILNFHGETIQKIQLDKNQKDIDISGLQPSLYFIKIIHENRVILEKFIKN